jgi:3-phenylpropionate/cinnamic acid dioxygenase small subunit
MDLQQVADRMEITDLLSRYCHALDQMDWEAFRAVFTPAAEPDFTAFGGPKGNVQDLEAFLKPVLEGLSGYQHTISTIKIDLDGDFAKARSAAIVPMTPQSSDSSERTFISGLWYEDRLQRTPNGWRISSRKQVRSWALAPV